MATSFVFIVDWKAGRCNNVVEVRLLRFSEACNDKVDKPPKQSIYCIRPLPFPESSMNVSFVQSQTLVMMEATDSETIYTEQLHLHPR
ncbi:hypothetical protein F2Q68_00020381 [Brassica cretica]|uniref:Uncharacterized protein n=1 Tax=Brassica cretica TaxID=69181 RepID=A0A8S9FW13_BRACR|nr:hypothetical protein F2Q68_00020381 [Brassica cretica]